MSTKFYHFANFQDSCETADFIFDIAHAVSPFIDQVPHLAQQAYHGIYGYTPSVGDLSAVPLLANAGNYGKWINKAKESYKAHENLPKGKRIGMTAWDTGAQVLRDSEGWGNPIVDAIGAAERNVRGVYDKSKELGRKLTPKETLAISGKAAMETAKSQILTRPKFLAGIPSMVKSTASGIKSSFPELTSKISSTNPLKNFRRKPKL